MKTIRMEDMNWPDIKEAIAKGFTTVVIGIGSNEQHGPHLPEKTDSLIADAISYRVAEKLENVLQAPTIRLGCSEHHLAFPGTISLRSETLKSIISDYIESLEKHGFRTVVLLPCHGGNFTSVQEAIDELKERHPQLRIIGYTNLKGFIDAQINIAKEFGITPEEGGAHAGEIETSFVLALEEHLVAKERFTPGYLGPLGEKEIKIILEKGMPALTEKGILGDPGKATAQKGHVYLERNVEFLVEEIKKQLK
ncbi:MAG: creatininase family protein [Candidatus Aminicenantes bacterium]|nr:MAG: creatininase family protein [Candidatus Aminicenantes bacterium]